MRWKLTVPSTVTYITFLERRIADTEGKLTLHDASILCRVTHTAETLRTGDHSVPRIEAQIYGASDVPQHAEFGMDRTHMSIGVYMLIDGQPSRQAPTIYIYAPDAQVPLTPG
jgi:hypothetical protein